MLNRSGLNSVYKTAKIRLKRILMRKMYIVLKYKNKCQELPIMKDMTPIDQAFNYKKSLVCIEISDGYVDLLAIFI